MSRRPRLWSTAEWLTSGVLTLTLVTLGGVFLHHAGGLWRDEANTVVVATAPSWALLWRRLEFDSFPLLWPALERGWIAVLGSSDVAVRALGALGGLTLPAAIWFAARRLGRAVPLVSLALLANPELIRWGVTVRAWSLGAALALVALTLMWEAVEAPRPRRIVLAGLSAILAVQCTYQNAVLLAAMTAGVLAAAWTLPDRRRLAIPVGISLVAACSLVPYVGTLSRLTAWMPINKVTLTVSIALARFSNTVAASSPFALLVWLVLVVAAVVGISRGRQARVTPVAVHATVTALLAILGIITLYRVAGYPPYAWYYSGLILLCSVCCESAVRAVWPTREAAVVLVAASLAVLAVGIVPTWRKLGPAMTNVDVIARELDTRAGPGDLVIVAPWLYDISFRRYYTGRAEVVTLPPLDDVSVHRYDLVKRRMQESDVMAPVLARTDAVLDAGRTVWIVGDPPSSAPGADRSLPLPPLPETGWRVLPYILAWEGQLGALLQRRATTATREVPGPPAQPLEYAVLLSYRRP